MIRRDPLVRLLAVALAVVAVDLASKAIAIGLVPLGGITLVGPFFLDLLYNDRMFGGSTDLGGWVGAASIAASSLLLLLALPIVRSLARYDASAPWILGLMSGAAIANPASLVLQPAGVTDFLGIELTEIAVLFNLADVAAYVGVAFAGRMVLRLWSAHRREATVPASRARWTEREVSVPLWSDVHAPAVVRRPSRIRRAPLADIGDARDHGHEIAAEQRAR